MYIRETITMSRNQDSQLLTQIAIKKLEGKTQEQIAQETGVCRQTVSSYLRSPEAQAIFNQTEEKALSFTNEAMEGLKKELVGLEPKNRAEILAKIVVALGSKVIGAGAKVSQSVTKPVQMTPEARQERIETLKRLLLGEAVNTGEDMPVTEPNTPQNTENDQKDA
jgi:transcriptional regulator with XRE-family HTH domain